MANLERNYKVPLRKGFQKAARGKRTPRAVKELKSFISKHMKSDEVKIEKELNNHIWQDGIKNPPHHVRVTAVKKDNTAKVNLEGKKPVFEEDEKEKKVQNTKETEQESKGEESLEEKAGSSQTQQEEKKSSEQTEESTKSEESASKSKSQSEKQEKKSSDENKGSEKSTSGNESKSQDNSSTKNNS